VNEEYFLLTRKYFHNNIGGNIVMKEKKESLKQIRDFLVNFIVRPRNMLERSYDYNVYDEDNNPLTTYQLMKKVLKVRKDNKRRKT